MKKHIARLLMAAELASICLLAYPAFARAPTEAEAQSIVTVCGGGLDTSVRAGLVAKLQGWARLLQGSAEIGAEAGKRTLGGLFVTLPSGQQIDPGLYKAFVDCVLKGTDSILKETSINSLSQLQIATEMFHSQVPGDADLVHHTFSKIYSRGMESSAGREIAVEMVEHLNLIRPSPALNVTLINAGGKLRLQEREGLASLHVSRFIHVMTLADLVKHPLTSIEPGSGYLHGYMANASIDIFHLAQKEVRPVQKDVRVAQESIEDGNFDWIARAGVYRIAVTAPFYLEHVIYVELSARGDLYVPLEGSSGSWDTPGSGSLKFQRLALPLHVTLMRSPHAPVRIAASIDVAAPNFPGASFPTEAHDLERGFAEAIRGYADYEFVPHGSAMYDPLPKKGLSSDHEAADMEVSVHATLLPVN